MYQLIVLFFQIAILRKGPQQVPASKWLLRLLLPAYVVINALLLWLNDYGYEAFLQIAIDFALMAGFTWPLLYFAGKLPRFQQTLGALLGTDIIISFFSLPVAVSLNGQVTEFAFIGMLLLMLWHWLVCGHIFRHALDRPLFFGLALAFLYILISSQVMSLIFPVVSTPS